MARVIAVVVLLSLATGLLVVTFPFLETVQLAFAGFVAGRAVGDSGVRGAARSMVLGIGALALLSAPLAAAQMLARAFALASSLDQWPGVPAVVLTPGVLGGVLVGVMLLVGQGLFGAAD